MTQIKKYAPPILLAIIILGVLSHAVYTAIVQEGQRAEAARLLEKKHQAMPSIAASTLNASSSPIVATTATATYTTTGYTICGSNGCTSYSGASFPATANTDDYAFTEAVRSQIPIEAQDAKEPRDAFRAWVKTLDDGRAKTAYLQILDQYDRLDEQEQQRRAAAEKRQKELLAEVPRATCKRIASVGADGTVKGGSYKCEPARSVH